MRRLRQHRRPGGTAGRPRRIILEASLEIRSAIVYATLIIVLAVMPVFFMGGLSGAFFEPLALSYALALLASMVVALTVTPALCLMLLDKAGDRARSPRSWDGCSAVTKRFFRGSFGRRAWHYAASGVVAGGRDRHLAAARPVAAAFVQGARLPDALADAARHVASGDVPGDGSRQSSELRSIPGVRNFGAHIGRALVADEPVGIDFTENWVSVDPKVDYDKTLAAIQETVDGYPGIYRDVQTYLRERIKEVLTGASESIVVRIFGPELDELRRQAAKVRQALAGIEGLVDLHEEPQKDIPQMRDHGRSRQGRTRRAQAGRCPRAAAIIFAGHEVSDIHRDGKVYDVMVWSTPETRHSLNSVRDLLLDTPDGGHVRLGDVADVRIAPAPNIIKRENASRRIDVHANVRGRDLGSVVQRRPGPACERPVPARVPRASAGRGCGTTGGPTGLADRSAAVTAIGIFFLLQAAFEELALGGHGLPGPAGGPGGRRARRLCGRPHHFARLAGRISHGPGNRGAQRHSADRPLSAPRSATKARPSVRGWSCAARGNGFRRS